MKHLFDFNYRGHEISILEQPSGEFAVDVREDDTDGEWFAGACDFKTQREAVIYGIDKAEQYIYDQTHFTEGISI